MTYLLLKIDQGHQDKKLVPRLVDVILKYGVIRSSGLLSRDKNVFLHGHDASFPPSFVVMVPSLDGLGSQKSKCYFRICLNLLTPMTYILFKLGQGHIEIKFGNIRSNSFSPESKMCFLHLLSQ
jgi:hypothetical protein